MLDVDSDLPAGAHFRLADGFDDALLIRFGEVLLCRSEPVEDGKQSHGVMILLPEIH
jgi:hypothetical protein